MMNRYQFAPQNGFGTDASIEMFLTGPDKDRCVAAQRESGEVIFVGSGAQKMQEVYDEVTTWKWVALSSIPAGVLLGGLIGWYLGKRKRT